MTIWSTVRSDRTRRRRWALLLLWGLLPFIGVAYQVVAGQTAAATGGAPFGLAWFTQIPVLRWGLLLLALEIASFLAWMVVLSEMKLSAAFPLSALSYVLVILVSWRLLHEPIDALQIAGGALIMGGVWLIGRAPVTGAAIGPGSP